MGNSSFFSNPTDYQVVDEGGEGSSFYDGPAYTEIDPVAINNSVAEAAASATASEVSHQASQTSATASAASAAAALASQTAAATSETNASTSATSADASETAAAASATTATTQAGTATTKAAEAATSAAAALVSEGNADTSEAAAASSASAASTSASAASTSETNAAASASAAATSATNAASAVQAAAGTATPLVDGTAAVGSGTKWAHEDHVHPTDTSRADAAATTAALALKAPLASPALTGTPTAPTATLGDNSTKLATTAFVLANSSSSGADMVSTNNLSDLTSAPTALTNLGGTTTGKALFTAVDAAAARTTLGYKWEPIVADSGTNVASWTLTGLSAYRMLRLTIKLRSAVNDAYINFRTSSNNGSSYDATPGDYLTANLIGNATTAASGGSSESALTLGGSGSTSPLAASHIITLLDFNQAEYCFMQSQGFAISSTNVKTVEMRGCARAQATARDAVQVSLSSGNIAKFIIIAEGVKG